MAEGDGMAKDLAGTTLGKYQVMERLGRGGMADVYRAYQPGLDRYVAIKVMHGHLTEDPSFITRFKREAHSVASLRHPNIVQVIDFDVQDDEYYMVMEYIQGQTLKALLQRQGALPVAQALDIAIRLADALAYAHSQGMIHRDIKPANILFSKDNTPILADFGIARLMDLSGLTAGSAVVGTPAYISPEAGRGEKVDERADIYGLGIVLYEMLTGKVPYDADTPYAVILKHINDPLPLPRQFVESLPESVERIVLKALAKNKEDRFQTAAEFKTALENARAGVASELPTQTEMKRTRSAQETQAGTIVETPAPRPASRSLSLGIAAVVIVVVVLGGVVLLASRPTATPPAATNTALVLAPTSAATSTSAPTAPPVGVGISPTAATTAISTAVATPTSLPATSGATAQTGAGKYAQLTADVMRSLIAESPERELERVEAALKADPQSYDLLVLRARIRVEIGDLRNKSGEDAEAAIKIDPNRPEAYVALGVYYQFRDKPEGNSDAAVEDYRKAVANYTQAIEKGSTDYYLFWLRGWANNNINGYIGSDNGVSQADILKDLERAASFAPPDARFYQWLGDYYFGVRVYPEAQTAYEKAAALRPDSTPLHARLGPTYLLLNQKQKAFDLYLNGIDKERNRDPKYIADGAYVAWANGQATKAKEWIDLALALEPNTPAAVYVQALLDMDNQNNEKALAKLDQVKAVEDTNTYEYPYLNRLLGRDINADRARALAALGRIDDALNAYDESLKEYNGWIPAWVEKARLLQEQGRIAEARAALREALDLADQYKDDKAAAEILALLKQLGPEPPTPTETPES
jgi:serine/threonine protein kinase/tetratricopeptide (TPR) repeat protein